MKYLMKNVGIFSPKSGSTQSGESQRLAQKERLQVCFKGWNGSLVVQRLQVKKNYYEYILLYF